MLWRLFFFLSFDLPGDPPNPAKPIGATRVKYIEALEDNTELIYPAMALLVIVLIALGILQAMRSDEMDSVKKAELKRDIIRYLRYDPLGLSVTALSKQVNVPAHRLFKVLEEMAEHGMVESFTNTRRETTWRVKGLQG